MSTPTDTSQEFPGGLEWNTYVGVTAIRPIFELRSDSHDALEWQRCHICNAGPGSALPWQRGNPLADVTPAQPWTPRRAA